MENSVTQSRYHDNEWTKFTAERLRNFLDGFTFAAKVNLGETNLEPSLIPLPDFSPSLNFARLRAGIPVGGILTWPSQWRDLMPALLPINGCGVAVAELTQHIQPQDVLAQLVEIANQSLTVENQKIWLDIGRKNHFLNLYSDKAGRTFAILHCSASEVKRRPNAAAATAVDTPTGRFYFLAGSAVVEARRDAARIEAFGLAKRELILRSAFPGCSIIFNQNHNKLVTDDIFALGCYIDELPFSYAPILIAPGEKAFLVKSAAQEFIGGRRLYVIPHGTGTAMSRPGHVSLLEGVNRFRVDRDYVSYYDRPEDVFDTFQSFEAVEPNLKPWLSTGVIPLFPIVEFQLRHGLPPRSDWLDA